MDVVTHGLAGALMVRAIRGRPGWLPIAATVGGALFPDLDAVGRHDTLTVQELIDLVAYLRALRLLPPSSGAVGGQGGHAIH